MRKNAQNTFRSTQFVCSSNVLLSNLILTNQNKNWSFIYNIYKISINIYRCRYLQTYLSIWPRRAWRRCRPAPPSGDCTGPPWPAGNLQTQIGLDQCTYVPIPNITTDCDQQTEMVIRKVWSETSNFRDALLTLLTAAMDSWEMCLLNWLPISKWQEWFSVDDKLLLVQMTEWRRCCCCCCCCYEFN